MSVSFTGDQSFFLQPVHNAGQVADRDHHLFADLAEGKTAGVTDSGQDIELGRGETQLFQIVLQFLVRNEIETQKAQKE